MIRSPITEPDRARIVALDRRDNQIDAIVDVFVTGNCAAEQQIWFRITSIVLDQIRVTIAIRVDERTDDSKARPLTIEILAITRLRAVCDNTFDIPFAGVEEKTDQ